MKKIFVMALLAASTAACAASGDRKTELAQAAPAPAAKPACQEPPKELVKKDVVVPKEGAPVRFRTAVHVQYAGWLYDGCAPDLKGTQFDTSAGRATPFGFIVGAGRVIKGWDEGLVGMKEGGKRTLVIPPDKAYGASGAGGGRIPPNATLVFDVEVIKVIAQGDGQP